MVIYKIINKLNGKIYIGQTIRKIEMRISEHKKSAFIDMEESPLYRSMRKYGYESFEFEIIDTADSLEELNEKEIYYIDVLKSRDDNYGYNIAFGGGNRDNWNALSEERKDETRLKWKIKRDSWTDEFKQLIVLKIQKSIENKPVEWHSNRRLSASKRFSDYHQNLTKEEKIEQSKSISLRMTRKSKSKLTRSRISKSLLGRFVGEKNPNYNNNWSEDKRKESSEYFRLNRDFTGSKNPKAVKTVLIHIETGEIEFFDSGIELYTKYNLKLSSAPLYVDIQKVFLRKYILLRETTFKTITDIDTYVKLCIDNFQPSFSKKLYEKSYINRN